MNRVRQLGALRIAGAACVVLGLLLWGLGAIRDGMQSDRYEGNALPATLRTAGPSETRALEVDTQAGGRIVVDTGNAVTEEPARLAVVVKSKGSHTELGDVHVRLLMPVKSVAGGSVVDSAESEYEIAAEGATGDEGRWDCVVAPNRRGLLRVWNKKTPNDQYEFKVSPVDSGREREMVVEIPAPNDLRVRCIVLMRENLAPVAGAEAYLLLALPDVMRRTWPTASPGPLTETPQAVSDERGLLDFWAIDLLQACVEVRAKGCAPARFAPEADGPTGPQQVLLNRAGSLRVLVRTPEGAAVEHALVGMMADAVTILQPLQSATVNDQNPDPLRWSVETNAEGRCEIKGLPPNVPLRAVVAKANGIPSKIDKPLVLEPGEEREVQWVLGRMCTVKGRVLDEEDHPVEGVPLCAWAADSIRCLPLEPIAGRDITGRTVSGPLGQYQMPPLPEGRWWFGSDVRGKTQSVVDGKVVVPAVAVLSSGVASLELDLRIRHAEHISGRVLEASGVGACPARVVARLEDGSYSSSTYTSNTGDFTIGPLLPGAYSIAASALGGASRRLDYLVQAGTTNVVVQLPATFSLTGVVVDQATGEARHAKVTAGLVGAAGLFDKQLPTKRDGTFRIEGLPVGEWELSAYTDDIQCSSGYRVSITGAREYEPVVLEVSPGAILRIRCKNNTQIPGLTLIKNGATIRMAQIRQGETISMIAPLGDSTLRYWRNSPGGGYQEQNLNVSITREGEGVTLELEGIGD